MSGEAAKHQLQAHNAPAESWSGCLTVVSVCKDDVQGLRRTAMSLRSQSTSDWHHVVIVASSDPESVSYAESLQDDRTTVVVQEPRGVYQAMNLGWQVARNPWIHFLNAGDTYAQQGSLEFALQELRNCQVRWAAFGCQVRSSTGTVAVRPREAFTARDYAYGKASVLHPSVIMRRSLIDDLGGFRTDLRIASDFDLILRARIHSQPQTSPILLSEFNVGGISTRNPAQSQREMHKVRLQAFDMTAQQLVVEYAHFPYHLLRSWIGQLVHSSTHSRE